MVPDPDEILGQSTGVVATVDAVILDRCGTRFNLERRAVESEVPARPGSSRWAGRGTLE